MIIKAIHFNYSKMETSTTNYVREVREGTTYESVVGVLDVPDSDIYKCYRTGHSLLTFKQYYTYTVCAPKHISFS